MRFLSPSATGYNYSFRIVSCMNRILFIICLSIFSDLPDLRYLLEVLKFTQICDSTDNNNKDFYKDSLRVVNYFFI